MPSFLEKAPSVLEDAVLLFHRFDTAQLIKAYDEQELDSLTADGGLFDKLCQLYDLEDSLGNPIQLVCFGVSAYVHFSENCWVINAAKLYTFDSCRGAGHATVISNAIKPFIDYLIDRCSFVTSDELETVNVSGIAPQARGSNICAFSASLCLGKVRSLPHSQSHA